MGQTRRKRKTKHRGNAAGMVQSRGRTGRKPSSDERKQASAAKGPTTRANRLDSPPTWRSAFTRAVIAAAIFFVLVALVFKEKLAGAATISAVMLALYTPLGYYTDLAMYRRRQRKKLAGGGR